jgi:pumilio RNA-binding family
MLAAHILNMSRQKYASNVVEKCLAFGTQVERQILIAEMLGPTEENEALQVLFSPLFNPTHSFLGFW